MCDHVRRVWGCLAKLTGPTVQQIFMVKMCPVKSSVLTTHVLCCLINKAFKQSVCFSFSPIKECIKNPNNVFSFFKNLYRYFAGKNVKNNKVLYFDPITRWHSSCLQSQSSWMDLLIMMMMSSCSVLCLSWSTWLKSIESGEGVCLSQICCFLFFKSNVVKSSFWFTVSPVEPLRNHPGACWVDDY